MYNIDLPLTIDFEELDRCIESAEAGDGRHVAKVAEEIGWMARRVSRWQWVMHGDTAEYRAGVTDWLLNEGKYGKAKRYACCGRGDIGYSGEVTAAVKVVPKCCGYRLCPRCSRRYGRKILRKVGKHLSEGPHGAIDHIVLTQKVIDGECLEKTRARFEKKWTKIYKRFRLLGLRSMLVTYHVKRTRAVGWHYHAHCVVEWKDEVDSEACCVGISNLWGEILRGANETCHPLFYRHVAAPGAALVELEGDGQGEFWTEAKDPVAQLLQYCIRDVVQGIENWVEGVDSGELTAEFAAAVDGAKLHRLYGVWRKKIDEVEEEDEADAAACATAEEKAKAAKDGVLWIKLGSVDAVLSQAGMGISVMVEFARSLACTFFNRSSVYQRLSVVLRSIGPSTG